MDAGMMSEFLVPLIIMGGISLLLGLLLVLADRFIAQYGSCELVVNGERKIEVQGGQPLLASLVSSKIFIPSACGGRGTCGYCRVKVLKGAGPLLPTERPYLTASEISEGYRIACQVRVKGYMEISIPDEYFAIREFRTTVASTRSLTHDIKEVHFRLDEPKTIRFNPGQYLQLEVPVERGPSVYRAYSIASAPSISDEIELIVKLVPGGIGSTYIHALKEGESVLFSGPYGEMQFHESGRDIICVGGGAGIAPLKSIIYSLLDSGTERSISLFFGVRSRKDLFYQEEFERLSKEHPNFHYIFALSSPEESDQWEGKKGFIHLVVEQEIAAGTELDAYLCGPPVMVDAVIKVLNEKGVPPERIFYDKF